MFRNSKRAGTRPKAETNPEVEASPKVGTSLTSTVPTDEKNPSEPKPDVEDGNTTEEATEAGPSETDIAEFTTLSKQLAEELCSIVIGQERVIRELLLALLAGGHVLLEGVPGLGKTLLVRTLADVFALKFARIQFTPDLMPADIVGTTIVTEQTDMHNASGGNKRAFSFQPGPIFANIVLAYEVNRATP